MLKRGERLPRDDVPPDVYELMRECWNIVDTKRPTFAQLEKELEKGVAGSYQGDLGQDADR